MASAVSVHQAAIKPTKKGDKSSREPALVSSRRVIETTWHGGREPCTAQPRGSFTRHGIVSPESQSTTKYREAKPRPLGNRCRGEYRAEQPLLYSAVSPSLCLGEEQNDVRRSLFSFLNVVKLLSLTKADWIFNLNLFFSRLITSTEKHGWCCSRSEGRTCPRSQGSFYPHMYQIIIRMIILGWGSEAG